MWGVFEYDNLRIYTSCTCNAGYTVRETVVISRLGSHNLGRSLDQGAFGQAQTAARKSV